MSGKILTANFLRDGLVVFLTKDHQWSLKVDDAHIAQDQPEEKKLEQKGQIDKQANIIVDPYLVAVHDIDGHIKADHIRERMRTLGPTVRSDLGKQADGDGGQFASADKGD